MYSIKFSVHSHLVYLQSKIQKRFNPWLCEKQDHRRASLLQTHSYETKYFPIFINFYVSNALIKSKLRKINKFYKAYYIKTMVKKTYIEEMLKKDLRGRQHRQRLAYLLLYLSVQQTKCQVFRFEILVLFLIGLQITR